MENEKMLEKELLPLTVYCSGQLGNPKNCCYPHKATVSTAEELYSAIQTDHTFIEFENNYRSKDNFRKSDLAVTDNDNDHSDNPDDWVSLEDAPKLFPGVAGFAYTSRHHMKQKGNRSPRPRFHVALLVESITSADEYTSLLKKIHSMYPFFDDKALDAGRFFFGNPEVQVVIFPGTMTLNQFLENKKAEQGPTFAAEQFAIEDAEQYLANLERTIPEGSRNSTLSHAAGKILKRWGDTQKAYEAYIEEVARCSPPLPEQEIQSVWKSAQRFFHEKVKKQPGYVPAEVYNAPKEPQWELPIPFTQHSLPSFPIDAFPPALRDYVLAVVETTQTPVDMSASAALAILALCQQGKYRIKGKEDWIEPLNLFVVIIAEPSERKSAVISHLIRPVSQYEAEYNTMYSNELEINKMKKRILEKRQRAVEDKVVKGKAEPGELEEIADEVANFRELQPMRLYVDDVTTEKLTSILSDNNGTAAVVSAEGGIFDMLSGIYTKNVNIDVFLKGHSGDTIRVDRIGRNSESIMNPALTVLLTVQPSVLSGMMQNGTFRGRGLTARFMYCLPTSMVGDRKYRTEPIPDEVSRCYEVMIRNLLQDEIPKVPGLIYLSPEADQLLEAFAGEVEGKLKNEYADIPDWAGKLVGAVLRIAGLLCRAVNARCIDFLDIPESMTVDAQTMAGAIAIGRYFTEHSRAAYALMGADDLVKQSQYALDAIIKNGLVEFTRRDIMRLCRSFKTAEQVQPVLNHLADLGYVAMKETDSTPGKGRPANPTYMVNPLVYRNAA